MERMNVDYGDCGHCGVKLVPVFFTEEETKTVPFGTQAKGAYMYRTGRKRRAVSHLECPVCLKSYTVDDSFDGPWH